MKSVDSRKMYVLFGPDGHVVEWAGLRFRRTDFQNFCLDGLLGGSEYERLAHNKQAAWKLISDRGYHIERLDITTTPNTPPRRRGRGRKP